MEQENFVSHLSPGDVFSVHRYVLVVDDNTRHPLSAMISLAEFHRNLL